MNANLTLSEIITIAFIMLLVFGPQRLPEMARKAGEILGKLRTAAASIVSEFNTEYEEIAKPLKDLDAELKVVKSELRDAIPDMTPITEDLEAALDPANDGESAAPQGKDVSGNGEADPFEAELAAARDAARAELEAEGDSGAAAAPAADEIGQDESEAS